MQVYGMLWCKSLSWIFIGHIIFIQDVNMNVVYLNLQYSVVYESTER